MKFLIRKDSDDKGIANEVANADIYGLNEHKDKPFKKILDLGGHIGSFAARAARTWPEAQIVSYEPTRNSGLLF